MNPRIKWLIIISSTTLVIALIVFVIWLRIRSNVDDAPVFTTATTSSTRTPAPNPIAGDNRGLKPTEDTDGDGLSDDEEARLGTSPFLRDTDGDGVTDDEEVNVAKTDPLVDNSVHVPPSPPPDLSSPLPTPPSPKTIDADGDGLTDEDEINNYKTDPNKKDTDGDSYPDGEEVAKGYNPRGSGKCSKPDCTP